MSYEDRVDAAFDNEQDRFLDLVDKGEKFEEAREWLKELIHEMYGEADITRIENAVEEIAALFSIKVPSHEIPLSQV